MASEPQPALSLAKCWARVDLIGHQLAHAVKDPNGRAYNRTAFAGAPEDDADLGRLSGQAAYRRHRPAISWRRGLIFLGRRQFTVAWRLVGAVFSIWSNVPAPTDFLWLWLDTALVDPP